MEILELKVTMTEIRILMDEFHNRTGIAEERISKWIQVRIKYPEWCRKRSNSENTEKLKYIEDIVTSNIGSQCPEGKE